MQPLDQNASRLFGDEGARQLAEASLRSITLATSTARGEDFFLQLVKSLAEALDVFYVIAGEVCIMEGAESIRTLAVRAGDQYLPNMSYGLACTPCRNVADQSMCFHASRIQEHYPDDRLLVEMGAESYIGMPMVGSNGKTLGILVAMDIKPMDEDKRLLALSLLSIFSARCATEVEHRQREASLESLVAERTQALKDAQARLIEHEKLAALGALVAGMAHEINTPLGVAVSTTSTLMGLADALVEKVSAEKVSRTTLTGLASQIHQGSELSLRSLNRAAALIDCFKQLTVDQSAEGVSEISLAEYLLSLCKAEQPAFNSYQASFHIDASPRLKARLPCAMLTQILTSLLMNALEHGLAGRPKGTVTFAAAARGETLLLGVADDGVGVEPDVRAHMFEPFFTTTRAQGGVGLGLHIVYTMVQRLNGVIAVESEPGAGLCVRIELPNCVVEQ